MQLNDTAIVLNTRKYNDSSIIMKVITENNGIYSGLVRIKKNQGGFGVNITGNKLNLMWRARLSEHLGFFTTELNKSRAHEIMKDQIFLSGINLVCSHLDLYPEREPCQNIYIEFDNLIDNFNKKENIWIKKLIEFEFNYLEFMGFGIDLYLEWFKFSPSIRGVFAISDEHVPDNDIVSPWTNNIEFMKTSGILINFTFQ